MHKNSLVYYCDAIIFFASLHGIIVVVLQYLYLYNVMSFESACLEDTICEFI